MAALAEMTRRIRRSGANPTTRTTTWPNWRWSSSSAASNVSDETALTLTAFYRGVSLIASTVAGLPLHIFKEDEDGTGTRIKTPDTAYLWYEPNNEMTRVTFWERVVADEVRGNAFIWVEKNGLGLPAHIWWIDRRRVRVGRNSDGLKIYELDNEIPMIDYKQGGEVVHIPNWGDGLVGYDIVKLAAHALALGLSAEEYAAQTFANGGIPPGLLTTEQELTPAEAQALSEQWHANRAGATNAAKVAVIGKGAKFERTGWEPDKMEREALRKYQAGEIATLLGIAPHMLGLVDRVTSWGSGIAEQGRGFVTYTLNAHTTRIKQAIDGALLVRELTERYCEFDPGGLLRGNLLQQYQAHAIALNRWMTVNEVRKDQNMEPIEGGDVLMQPLNMAPLEEVLGFGDEKEPAANR